MPYAPGSIDVLLSLVTLATPGESPVRQEAVVAVAVALEIADPRETRYLNAASDLPLLQRRYAELYDAPPAVDALRFPSREVASELCAANRQYKTYLEDRQRLFIHVDYTEHLWECDRLYSLYDLIRDANCTYYYVTVRRTALKKLREQLGFDAYYNASIPGCIPY